MKNIFVISVLSILTVACGKDVKEDKKDGPDRGYSLLGIENTVWERPCKASEDKTRSAKRILDLKQTSAIYSKIYFTGLDCLEENKRISYVRKHHKKSHAARSQMSEQPQDPSKEFRQYNLLEWQLLSYSEIL